MLEAVIQRYQPLLLFATWSYATPTSLGLRGSAATIAPTEGVCQGDPWEQLFFAFAQKGLLEELQDVFLARPLAYSDDIFLQGTRGDVKATFPVMWALLELLGLQVMPSKCWAHSAVRAKGAAVSSALGTQHALKRAHCSWYSSRAGCLCGGLYAGLCVQHMPLHGGSQRASLPSSGPLTPPAGVAAAPRGAPPPFRQSGWL
jgi:hypothetical protein